MKHIRVPRWLLVAALALGALSGLGIGPAQAGTVQCPGVGAPIVDGYPLPPGTGEVSGLVASARYQGWGWMIRDSGSPAALTPCAFPAVVVPTRCESSGYWTR